MKKVLDLREEVFAYPVSYEEDGKITRYELHFGKHVVVLNENQVKEIKGN